MRSACFVAQCSFVGSGRNNCCEMLGMVVADEEHIAVPRKTDIYTQLLDHQHHLNLLQLSGHCFVIDAVCGKFGNTAVGLSQEVVRI